MTKEIRSTITLPDAAATDWDAIVIGAGLAGCIAARGLAQQGRRVLLVERATFPRDKVCGACLNQDAVAGFEAIGLGQRLRRLDCQPLRQFQMYAHGRSVALPLAGGLAVSRRSLDSMLVEAAIEAGASFLSPVAVRVGAADSDDVVRTVMTLEAKTPLRGNTVIVASGLASQKRIDDAQSESVADQHSRIGLGLQCHSFPPQFALGTIYMAVAADGYVGMARTSADVLNIAAAVDRQALQSRSPGQACQEILQAAGVTEFPDLLTGDWRGTSPLTRHRPQAASHRLFFVGDASGYIEPFTGEGMAWAIRGGRAVVSVADQAIDDWQPALISQWTQTTRQLVGGHQRWCRMLAKGLRYPKLTGGVVRIVSKFPSLGRAVVRQLNQEVTV